MRPIRGKQLQRYPLPQWGVPICKYLYIYIYIYIYYVLYITYTIPWNKCRPFKFPLIYIFFDFFFEFWRHGTLKFKIYRRRSSLLQNSVEIRWNFDGFVNIFRFFKNAAYIHMYVYIYIYIYIWYIYIYINTYMYIYIYVYIPGATTVLGNAQKFFNYLIELI